MPPSEIHTFGSTAARQKMLQSGRIGRAWQQNYTVASRVPLHPSMGPTDLDYDPSTESNSPLSRAALSFVHGGLSPTYEHLTPYPSRINELGARLLQRLMEQEFPPPHPPYPYRGLPDDATPEEHSLYGSDGPLWYRGWAMDDERDVCSRVDDVLQRTGVRRLIMGHTPNFHVGDVYYKHTITECSDSLQKIVSRCGGKIIIIDTGMLFERPPCPMLTQAQVYHMHMVASYQLSRLNILSLRTRTTNDVGQSEKLSLLYTR